MVNENEYRLHLLFLAINPDINHLIVEAQVPRNRRAFSRWIPVIPYQIPIDPPINIDVVIVSLAFVWTQCFRIARRQVLPVDARRRDIVSCRERRFKQKQRVRRLCKRDTVNCYLDVPRRRQDIDALIWILWMAVNRHILFEPLIYSPKVDFDKVFQRASVENEYAVTAAVADCQFGKMSTAVRAVNWRGFGYLDIASEA